MFEAIAPPARSRLWDPADVTAAQAILDEQDEGKQVVGWNEPFDTEGKARGAGTALARMLLDTPGSEIKGFRVSVFERADDPDNGIEEGFYFSIKPKGQTEDENLVNPADHSRDALVKMAADAGVTHAEKATKVQIAKAINESATVEAEA